MTPPERMRALLAQPEFVVMPAIWDGLTAKLAFGAGFKTAFLSGSCVAASCSAVTWPYVARSFASAPRSSKMRTTSSWPACLGEVFLCSIARCSGR